MSGRSSCIPEQNHEDGLRQQILQEILYSPLEEFHPQSKFYFRMFIIHTLAEYKYSQETVLCVYGVSEKNQILILDMWKVAIGVIVVSNTKKNSVSMSMRR